MLRECAFCPAVTMYRVSGAERPWSVLEILEYACREALFGAELLIEPADELIVGTVIRVALHTNLIAVGRSEAGMSASIFTATGSNRLTGITLFGKGWRVSGSRMRPLPLG